MLSCDTSLLLVMCLAVDYFFYETYLKNISGDVFINKVITCLRDLPTRRACKQYLPCLGVTQVAVFDQHISKRAFTSADGRWRLLP